MSLIKPLGLPKGGIGQFVVDGVADGYEAFALAQAASETAPDGPIIFVARDGQRLQPIVEALAFAAPELPVLEFPAWDCLPYDRAPGGYFDHGKRTVAAHSASRNNRIPNLPCQARQSGRHERTGGAA
jgi:transcription-repair coupling factor (superfamily II helicase)